MTEQFRCFCLHKPILGVIKTEGKRIVFHIKVYKQSRVFAEIFLDAGTMRFRCRECFRLHRITIVQNRRPEFKLESDTAPDDEVVVV